MLKRSLYSTLLLSLVLSSSVFASDPAKPVNPVPPTPQEQPVNPPQPMPQPQTPPQPIATGNKRKPTKPTTIPNPTNPPSPLVSNAAEQFMNLLTPVNTMEGNFQQTVISAQRKVLQESKGSMEFKRPSLFRWEVDKPDKSLVVTDGHTLWNYDELLEQVIIKPFKTNINLSPVSFLFAELKQLQRDFNVAEVKDPSVDRCFRLTPKSADATFVAVEVGFDQGVIKILRLQDPLGQISVFEFSQVKNNTKISDLRFNFVPPKNVEVISEL